jgi:ABC-type nitrate/sulfonate/bicarbonate transport system substrate-binding protein
MTDSNSTPDFNARRKALRSIAAAGAGIVGASLGARVPRARAADPPSAGTLTIGLLRNPVSALITLTEQKGWFKAAGLELQSSLFTGAGGPKVIQAMGGGSLALGSVSATAALLAITSQAVPLRIVSISTDPAPVFVLLSAPDIQSMKQLAGKKVATTAGTGLQYFLARALQKHGMKMSDIEFVNLPVGDAQSAFLAGRDDAVVPSLNGRYFILNTRKETRELFKWEDFTKPPGATTPFEDYDVFIATQKAVETNGPALRAFLAAYHGKGVPYLLDKGTQAQAIAEITRYVNAEQKGATDEGAMKAQLLGSGFFDLDAARRIVRSDAFRAGLEDQVKYFVDSRQIPAPVALDKVIMSDLLG